jgi:hypothetical protein
VIIDPTGIGLGQKTPDYGELAALGKIIDTRLDAL